MRYTHKDVENLVELMKHYKTIANITYNTETPGDRYGTRYHIIIYFTTGKILYVDECGARQTHYELSLIRSTILALDSFSWQA